MKRESPKTNALLQALATNHTPHELAAVLEDKTPQAISKDLSVLVKKGLVVRQHGGLFYVNDVQLDKSCDKSYDNSFNMKSLVDEAVKQALKKSIPDDSHEKSHDKAGESDNTGLLATLEQLRSDLEFSESQSTFFQNQAQNFEALFNDLKRDFDMALEEHATNIKADNSHDTSGEDAEYNRLQLDLVVEADKTESDIECFLRLKVENTGLAMDKIGLLMAENGRLNSKGKPYTIATLAKWKAKK